MAPMQRSEERERRPRRPTEIFTVVSPSDEEPDFKDMLVRARRTAFIARFIVLRESKRSRAHRTLEIMEWDDLTSPEDLAERFLGVFRQNGDNLDPVERDLRRSLAHANRSLKHFVSEYAARSTVTFVDALIDYERSNSLLFVGEEQPRPGGWRLPREIIKGKAASR